MVKGMLPEFDDEGNLPAGIHLATLEELVARFGHGSPEREAGTAELIEFVQWARQHGFKRLLVDGSFVSEKVSPHDVDLVVFAGSAEAVQLEEDLSKAGKWPFLDIKVALDEADLQHWAMIDFGADQRGNPRGIVEVEL
jgi:hypothetical protein